VYGLTEEERKMVEGNEQVKLPNTERAVVEQEKIVEYLLNPVHPGNGGKAAFFFSLGFRSEDWQTFAKALRTLAAEAEVSKSVESQHGKKYIVDGTIESPSGRKRLVRTIWIVNKGSDVPRLVTAYPIEE
jgi:hypothetical protein